VPDKEDHRRIIEEAFGEPQRIVFTQSRLSMMLRRPHSLRYFNLHPYPSTARPKGADAMDWPEEKAWWMQLLSEVFVEPKFCVNAGPGELGPTSLSKAEIRWLVGWSVVELVGAWERLTKEPADPPPPHPPWRLC
jgi:hypothetical protein